MHHEEGHFQSCSVPVKVLHWQPQLGIFGLKCHNLLGKCLLCYRIQKHDNKQIDNGVVSISKHLPLFSLETFINIHDPQCASDLGHWFCLSPKRAFIQFDLASRKSCIVGMSGEHVIAGQALKPLLTCGENRPERQMPRPRSPPHSESSASPAVRSQLECIGLFYLLLPLFSTITPTSACYFLSVYWESYVDILKWWVTLAIVSWANPYKSLNYFTPKKSKINRHNFLYGSLFF